MIYGDYFVTPHAVRRYRERIDTTASYVEARDRIAELAMTARPDRGAPPWAWQLRAANNRFPGRIRLRLGPGEGGRPAILTVLPEHDRWRPRRSRRGLC